MAGLEIRYYRVPSDTDDARDVASLRCWRLIGKMVMGSCLALLPVVMISIHVSTELVSNFVNEPIDAFAWPTLHATTRPSSAALRGLGAQSQVMDTKLSSQVGALRHLSIPTSRSLQARADAEAATKPQTNAEGQDLLVPLPAWSKDDLKEVKLYQSEMSMPCVKIRGILQYFGVPYTRAKKTEDPPPDPSYTKIPSLVVNGRQINDSFIIVKELAKILMGRPLTEKEIEIERDLITYGTMLALELEAFESPSNLQSLGSAAFPDMPAWQKVLGWTASYPLSLLLPRLVRPGFSEKTELLKQTGVKPSKEYGAALAAELGKGPFFGGQEPGMVDLSLYGVVLAFAQHKCSVADRFLDSSKLRTWWNGMSDIFKEKGPIFQSA